MGRWVGILLALALAGCGALTDSGDPQEFKPFRPNFVIVYADDLGYGDIEPFGSTVNRTPNLNRMAYEGMKLTSFYAAPLCTPARAALLTGCYPKRVGLDRGPFAPVLFPGSEEGIHADETTLAELLGEAGYATGIIGKWHLGDQPDYLPTRHGFDVWFGLPYSNDMIPAAPAYRNRDYPPLPLMHNEEIVQEVVDQTGITEAYTDAAVQFIETHREQPFFLYVAHTMVHEPLHAGPAFRRQSENGLLGDAIEEIDWSVGRVLDALKVNGLDRRTLVVFTSDNGPDQGTAGPLRGRKGSTFEGGMREPTIAWYLGVIPPESESDEVASVMDLLPTFADYAGVEPPADRIIDGRSIRGILEARPDARSPHEAFYYYQQDRLRAVRSGPWKLFATGELYDLDHDIGETTDLAAERPEIVEMLTVYLERAREDLGDGDEFPGAGVRKAGWIDEPRFLIPRPGETQHRPIDRGPLPGPFPATPPEGW